MSISSQDTLEIINIVKKTLSETTPILDLQSNVLTDTAGASKILHIPATTLVKWRSTGEVNIPFIRINRQIKYRTTDLLAYIEDHTYNKANKAA